MARERGGTVTVPAGTTALVILGTFVAPYEPGVLPGWATDTFVLAAAKLATQFTVNFTVAPAVANTADWSALDSG